MQSHFAILQTAGARLEESVLVLFNLIGVRS